MAKKKLNKELIQEICGYIANGVNPHDACQLVNISEAIYYRWLQIAEKEIEEQGLHDDEGETEEKPKSIYVDFFESIKVARQKYKAFHLQCINKSAKEGNWQASAWSLERSFPDEFGRVDRLDYERGNKSSQTEAMENLAKAIMLAANTKGKEDGE